MSRLLVDTHALLWWLSDDPALSLRARDALADPANELLVGTACLCEIAIMRDLGKLSVPDDLPAQVEAGGFGWLPVTPAHAWQVRALPRHHRDPFDRVLAAQSLIERVAIISADPQLRSYAVDIVW